MQFRRRRSSFSASAAGAMLALLFAGCDSPNGPTVPPSPAFTECGAENIFHRSNFSNPTVVNNRFFPLVPGSQFILDGVANRGGGLLPHRVVFTVTDVTKVINGVRCVVLWDRDYNNGRLAEAELAFFAQDNDGNVWSTGEYPEEYENGEFIGAPSTWVAGLADAEAGVHMAGEPHVGLKFMQGFAPNINFLDCSMIQTMGGTACVPFNCFENVLVTSERSPLDPGTGSQLKFHAPGIGIVQVGALDDPEGETLVLSNLVHLNAREMAEARVETLRLDQRAYSVSALYSRTAPAE